MNNINKYQYHGNKFTFIDFNWTTNLTTIWNNAFFNMQTLEWVLDIPSSVTTIGKEAFQRAFNPETVNILTWCEWVTSLWYDAFRDSKLTWILKSTKMTNIDRISISRKFIHLNRF